MKFLVIEGLDGSGKSTQVSMLKDYLKSNNVDFEYLHFPVTDSPVFGELVARFLRGDSGPVDQVDPYLVALLFAGDRYNYAEKIREWRKMEKFVLVDRYVYSNIAYQCAKLNDYKQKKKLADWIIKTEYKYFKIPEPDLSIYLDVPLDFVESRLKDERNGRDRDYLQGKKDIHEEDINFQKSVKDIYEMILSDYSDMYKIDCKKNDKEILPANDIFNKIIDSLKNNKMF